jgi:hypothetical protein
MFTDFLKVELCSCNETCITSHDGNDVISIKVEEVTDFQEEDPLSITLPAVNAEHEVSCISWCPLCGTFHKYPKLRTVFLVHICMST